MVRARSVPGPERAIAAKYSMEPDCHGPTEELFPQNCQSCITCSTPFIVNLVTAVFVTSMSCEVLIEMK